MSPTYYGLTACMREHKCSIADAHQKLIEMVKSGAAQWWPNMESIAVDRSETSQIQFEGKLL